MPRIGQNPLKWIESEIFPASITVALIVHIPELSGYWKDSLDILKLCLNSLRQNTKQPFDLMIFDNGSCAIVKDYLMAEKQTGKVQFLILSEYNLRKLGALNFLLACAPGNIISYSDSDVYFCKGWLDKSLELMDTFPEAGQISALPTADKVNAFCSSTYQAIERDPSIAVQRAESLIPEKYIRAHYSSIGKTEDTYLRSTGRRKDTKITRDGV